LTFGRTGAAHTDGRIVTRQPRVEVDAVVARADADAGAGAISC
jgi:hypothetical protein